MLNVSFHPSEIGEHLDLLYIHFKCGAMRELTQFASGLVHITRCACERLVEQNRARDPEYKRALRDRLHVCGKCKQLNREKR